MVAGVDQGLLFGHRRLVLFLRHADRADAAAVEELPDDALIAGQRHLARTEHDQVLGNSMPMLSGTVRAMLMLCVTIGDRAVNLRVDVDQRLRQSDQTGAVGVSNPRFAVGPKMLRSWFKPVRAVDTSQ